jgi:hypothetical protein
MRDGRDCGKAYIRNISEWSLFDMIRTIASPCPTYVSYRCAVTPFGGRDAVA